MSAITNTPAVSNLVKVLVKTGKLESHRLVVEVIANVQNSFRDTHSQVLPQSMATEISAQIVDQLQDLFDTAVTCSCELVPNDMDETNPIIEIEVRMANGIEIQHRCALIDDLYDVIKMDELPFP